MSPITDNLLDIFTNKNVPILRSNFKKISKKSETGGESYHKSSSAKKHVNIDETTMTNIPNKEPGKYQKIKNKLRVCFNGFGEVNMNLSHSYNG